MPLAFSSILHDLHNSFDIIKSELLSSARDVTTRRATEDERGPPPPPQVAMVADHPSDNSAAIIAKLKQQLQCKEERLASSLERLEEAHVQLQERDAVATSLVQTCANQTQRISVVEEQLRVCEASLHDERKQVIVLNERCNRHMKAIAALQETETAWRAWVDTTEVQAAETRSALQALQEGHQRMASTCSNAKRVEAELLHTRQRLASVDAQRSALQDEVNSLREGSQALAAVFNATADACRVWQQEAETTTSTMESLTQRLGAAEAQCCDLQQLIVELSAAAVLAPAPSPTMLSIQDSDAQLPSLPRADNDSNISSTGDFTSCSKCAMLESRLLQLTIEVGQRSEIVESLRHQLHQSETAQLAPLLHFVVAHEQQFVDRAVVDARWQELQSLLLALTKDVVDVEEEPPSLRSVSAMEGVGGVSANVTSEFSMFSHAGQVPNSSSSRMARWQLLLDTLAAAIQARSQRIDQLEQQLKNQHFLQAQGSGRAVVEMPPPTHTSTSTVAVVGQLNYCAACGWEVRGRRGGSDEDDNDISGDMATCRLCGDCFHKTCCRQSEALFVCHKHTAVVSSNHRVVATPAFASHHDLPGGTPSALRTTTTSTRRSSLGASGGRQKK